MKLSTAHKDFIIGFLKYLIVGGLAFVCDFGGYFILTRYFDVYYLLAAVISFIIGLNVNYALAKYIFFKQSKIKDTKKEYLSVALISVSSLFIKIILLWILTDFIGMYDLLSKIITTFFLLFYNFIIRKIFIFD
jgi:putative flippase GtrA